MREETQLDHLPFTAYHEAGHAVALCLLNIPFSHTTITSSEEFGYVGYTKWIPKDNPSRQEQLDIMVIALAGIVATLQLDGSYREAALAGTGNDLQCLEKIADNLLMS